MRPDQLGQIPTLAFYIFQFMRLRGEPANILDCIPQDNPEYDYHDILREAKGNVRNAISTAEAVGAWAWGNIQNIDEVDIDREDYEVIVRQIYPPNPVAWTNVRWENHPQINPDNVFEQCFDNYINEVAANGDTRESVNAIMERLNALLVERNINRTNGLVVGRVQSGKTQNFTGLALKAITEQWNMIIVLTSDNTALASQTRNRLNKSFTQSGLNRANSCELNFLQSTQNPQEIQIIPNFVYWGVAMKESNSLQRIIYFLNRQEAETVKQIKLLIIDDEADNATPNSAVGQDRFTEEEIDDYLDLLRAEGQENIADWLGSLKDFDIPEEPREQTTYQKEFLQRLNRCTSRNIAAFLTDYRNYLQLSFQNDDGENVDIYVESMNFYTVPRGNYINSRPLFIRLLKSIFAIASSKSTINRKICHIMDRDINEQYSYPFENCAYIGYTATPYACVFNERPDQTPIYPGFIYSLGKGHGYFGLDEIFGLETENYPPTLFPRMPIIYPITNDEDQHILTPLKKEETDFSINSDLVATHKEQEYEWDSLKKMIQWAFCAAAARRFARNHRLAAATAEPELLELNKLDYRWTSMLVNIAPKRAMHRKVKELIIEYLAGKLLTQEDFIVECLGTWDTMTSAQYLTEDRFRALFPEYPNFTPYPTREDIEVGVRSFIAGCRFYRDNQNKLCVNTQSLVHIIEINSTAEGKKCQCDYVQARTYPNTEEVPRLEGDHLWIISGGNTISRGLTLPGLVSSYFDRIKRNVAVDTMTQMGRWFGYRRGYELLPRLAMTGDTISEIKKVAVIEHRMHEEIDEKFHQNISPSDPTGYLAVYTCGRRLSGRQKALRTLNDSLGALSSTSQFYLRHNDIEDIKTQTDIFLQNIAGYARMRDPQEYQYAHYALWSDIPSTVIGRFLGEIKNSFPTKSKLKIQSWQQELTNADYAQFNWSVVIGEPEGHCPEFPFGDVNYRAGSPGIINLQNDVATYQNTRLHIPYYAMIPSSKLREVDLSLLREYKNKILRELNGQISADLDAVLRDGASVGERFDNTLDYYENNTESLPNSLHNLLNYVSTGYRNRSALEYMEATHDEDQYKNPILQIYLINPPEDMPDRQWPIISLAVYWPDHEPTGFVAGTLGLPEDFIRPVINISPDRFYQTVSAILHDSEFPVGTATLRAKVCGQLGCDNAYFSQRIRNSEKMAEYNYEPFPHKEAYCPVGWATGNNHLELLDREFCLAAYEVLVDSNEELSTIKLMQKTINLNPKFNDFYNVQNGTQNNDRTRFNQKFQELIASEGLPVRSPSIRPRTYVFDPEIEQGEE